MHNNNIMYTVSIALFSPVVNRLANAETRPGHERSFINISRRPLLRKDIVLLSPCVDLRRCFLFVYGPLLAAKCLIFNLCPYLFCFLINWTVKTIRLHVKYLYFTDWMRKINLFIFTIFWFAICQKVFICHVWKKPVNPFGFHFIFF